MPLPILRNRYGLALARQSGGFFVKPLGSYTIPGGLSTFEFPVVLGAPHPTREIIVAVLLRNGVFSQQAISSGFLYGSGLNIPAVNITQLFGIGGTRAYGLRFLVPQAIQNAVMSLSASGAVADHMTVSLLRVVNRQKYGENAVSSGGNGGSSGTSITTSAITIPPGGFLVGIGGHSNTSPNSIANAFPLDDNLITGGGGNTTGFWRANEPVSVAPTLTLSWSGSVGSIIGGWSFNP